MFKNVASTFLVFAFDATTNVPKGGDAANITAYVAIDGGAVTVLGDTSATEFDATNAPGYYWFTAAQAETNGDRLMVTGKSSTSNIKVIGAPAVIYTRPTTGWLAPTVAARTLDVSAGGEAGVDWANVGSPTTANALTATTIAVTQKVDVDTIKTNPVANAGTFTFPTNATGASTTNITAGTITTVTNLTNAATAGDFTATMKTSAQTAADAAISANALVLEIEADTDTLTGFITVAPPTANANADALLARNIAGGSSSGRIVTDALRFIRNKWSISGTTLTVTTEDDVTTAWTSTVTTDAAAVPITANDPT